MSASPRRRRACAHRVRMLLLSMAAALMCGAAQGDSAFSTGGTYRLRARVGPAAEVSDATRYRVHASIGQPEAGPALGDGRWLLRGGFWPQPGSAGPPTDVIFSDGFDGAL